MEVSSQIVAHITITILSNGTIILQLIEAVIKITLIIGIVLAQVIVHIIIVLIQIIQIEMGQAMAMKVEVQMRAQYQLALQPVVNI